MGYSTGFSQSLVATLEKTQKNTFSPFTVLGNFPHCAESFQRNL